MDIRRRYVQVPQLWAKIWFPYPCIQLDILMLKNHFAVFCVQVRAGGTLFKGNGYFVISTFALQLVILNLAFYARDTRTHLKRSQVLVFHLSCTDILYCFMGFHGREGEGYFLIWAI